MLRHPKRNDNRAIPVARSKFEAGVRKIIGGGEIEDWHKASSMYRGGGNTSDALLVLSNASDRLPGKYLTDLFNIRSAREVLCLPTGLSVPDGRNACNVKHFNEDATAGPFLRCFGVKRKEGLDKLLGDFVWNCFNDYCDSDFDERRLPFFMARLGFRTKLVELSEGFSRVAEGKSIGRAVMMLDATEQFASSPLYNVISSISAGQVLDKRSGFRNTVVRASADWMKFFDEVKEAKVCVELDWSKFDRERPADDINFIIDIVLSCFEPKNDWEERLLHGYGVCMRRALIERLIILDDGAVFSIDGMVPSGSLWTGWLDTALNILYLTAVLRELGWPDYVARPKCAGDDNLTLFLRDYPDDRLRLIRKYLNEWFLAGIEDEDFVITRAPFHVTTQQAVFPPGTMMDRGTSKILDKAKWVDFEGPLRIDEAGGLSHRWRFNFFGKPKFLSCYWLENGRPIRPAKDNLEKLLFPEGMHETVDDYIGALLSMVVDNPFNDHNVNHLKHRYLIAHQIRRVLVSGVPDAIVLKFSRIRAMGGEVVPFPMIAAWRRGPDYIDLDKYAPVRKWIEEFDSFVNGIQSLYIRSSRGGIDAYKFMDFIRGDVSIGPGQWGSDLSGWIQYIRSHPGTRRLRESRRFKERQVREEVTTANVVAATEAFDSLDQGLRAHRFTTPRDFAFYISDRIRDNL